MRSFSLTLRLRITHLSRPFHAQLLRNQLETIIVLVPLDLTSDGPQTYLLPTGDRLVVPSYERCRERVELWGTEAGRAITTTDEIADIEEDHDEVVEGVEAFFLDREPTVAVGGIAAFDLHSDLGKLSRSRSVSGIGVDADEVVTLVVGRGLVGQNVPPHEVTHNQMFGTGRDNGETEEVVGRHNSHRCIAGSVILRPGS